MEKTTQFTHKICIEQQNVQRVVNKTTTTKSPQTVTLAISTSVSILHQFQRPG